MILFPHFSEAISRLRLWFSEYQRDLAFRRILTPYHIWVSEIMSQQTTAKSIVPYFQRFLARFPDILSLSKASEEEVLKFWSGLGYYSRARNLLKTAQIIQLQYNGDFPPDFSILLKLPGIGPYTAGAILCFGFQVPSSIVDTNIKRVLCRLRATNLSDKRLRVLSHIFSAYSDEQISFSPRDTMQALMELGAILCKNRDPQCQICPLRNICFCVKKQKEPSSFPAPKKQKSKLFLYEDSLLCIAEDPGQISKILLILPKKRWTQGLWDLPTNIFPRKSHHWENHIAKLTIQYQITHHRIQREIFIFFPISEDLQAFLVTSLKKIPHRWIPFQSADDIHTFPLPAGSGLKKSLQAYLSWGKSDSFSKEKRGLSKPVESEKRKI